MRTRIKFHLEMLTLNPFSLSNFVDETFRRAGGEKESLALTLSLHVQCVPSTKNVCRSVKLNSEARIQTECSGRSFDVFASK